MMTLKDYEVHSRAKVHYLMNQAHSRKKLVLVSTGRLLPVNHGSAVRAYGIARTMSTLQYEVSIVCFVLEASKGARCQETFASGIKYVEASLLSLGAWRLVLRADIVQFEHPTYPWLMMFLRLTGKMVILDEHGVEYNLAQDNKSLRKFTFRSSQIKRLIAKFVLGPAFIHAVEGLSVKMAHRILAVSQIDSTSLQRIYSISPTKLVLIPNCIDAYNSNQHHLTQAIPRYAIFVGSFDHPPNLQGALILTREIVPRVREKVHLEFLLVGKSPPAAILSLNGVAGISVVGEVPSVTPYVESATIAVCPIWHGSGTRVKLLEYMKSGLPTVSTTKGAEGLEVKDGQCVILRDNVGEFADAIIDLLTHPDKAKRIGTAARDLVLAKYSWEAIKPVLALVYQ